MMVQTPSAKDDTMRAVKERMNLYISKPIADELRRLIPARERTQFVEDILARELRRAKLKQAIENSYGAWSDEDHPDMLTFDDVNRWIDEQRKLGSSRQEELDKLWRAGENE
jgi:hypothetical protein